MKSIRPGLRPSPTETPRNESHDEPRPPHASSNVAAPHTRLALAACVLFAATDLEAQPLDPAGEEARTERSQEPGEDQEEARVVTTRATRIERPLQRTPMSVSLLDAELIEQGQQRARLDESLKLVPGLFIQNRDNFAQGQRIAIRGAGARAPFGVRGITIVVDGIPYTLPDGQSQLDAIDLDSAALIEVVRGPSSLLYGNASGGAITIETADGTGSSALGQARAEFGSDAYSKWAASHGGERGAWAHHVSVSSLDLAGWRPQSRVEKRILNAKLTRRLGSRRAKLVAIVTLLDNPIAEDPGALNLEELGRQRRSAAPNALALNAGQRVAQQTAGLQLHDLALGPWGLSARAFYTHRDFSQRLPYVGDSLIGYRRHHAGGTLEARRSFGLSRSLRAHLVTGVDLAAQRDDRSRRLVGEAGEVGAFAEEELQQAGSVGAFFQFDLSILSAILLTIGARYDRVALGIDDQRPALEGDASGERDFDLLSATAGASWEWRREQSVWISTGTSFDTPTFSEFANPAAGGGFNPAVAPQRAWNREIGARGRLLEAELTYELALFSIVTSDEITPYEQQGRTLYRNTGETEREGIEAAVEWRHPAGLRVNSALTLARYRFTGGERDAIPLEGRRLPGAARAYVGHARGLEHARGALRDR